MAWNRPTERDQGIGNRKQGKFPFRGLITGAVVALGTAVAAWWLWPDESAPVAEGGDCTVERRIREVKPAVARTNETTATTPPKPKELPPQRVGEVRDGKLLMLSGELRVVKGVVTSGVTTVSVAEKTFKHTANRRIASLLRIVPGEGMLGSSEELFENFKEQFEESLKEEITFTPEDTDEQRELKQAVLDARKELLERKARGEDVARVMIDTRNQLQELGTYRHELEKQVERLRSDGDFSEQDEDDLVRAANTMLEDRGVMPLELPSMIKHALELERLNEEGESLNE